MEWNAIFEDSFSISDFNQSRGADLAGDGGSEEAEEVAEEGAVEVGDPQPVRRQWDPVLGQPRGLTSYFQFDFF